MTNRFLPAPGLPPQNPLDASGGHAPLTPDQMRQAAQNFSTQLVHEIETALIGEIEKIEGKVPAPIELMENGTSRKDLATGNEDFFWKGVLLVSVKVGEMNAEGQRGVMIEVHQQEVGGA